MNTLERRWDIRKGETFGNPIKHERNYIDFVVSGKPLSDILKTKKDDLISMFGWGANADYENHLIRVFLKQEPPELETGRTIIYGCPECGNIGCGAVTAEIIENGDKIIWKKFGYENNYGGLYFEEYSDVGEFEFDKQEYIREFERIAEELSNLKKTS
jgi:hypothetical protein